MVRERDALGRPRNARARDALGRPLPRGVAGVTAVPDDLDLGPDETLDEAQRLLDTARPFQAHEVLEAAWKHAPEGERDLWQGLAQLAVGLTHALRGNRTGAEALLTRGTGRIAPYAEAAPYAVDVPGLLSWAGELVDDLRGDAATAPAPLRLRRGTGSAVRR